MKIKLKTLLSFMNDELKEGRELKIDFFIDEIIKLCPTMKEKRDKIFVLLANETKLDDTFNKILELK